MRIVCIRWGDKYPWDYVCKLKHACDRHIPHDSFVCFSDDPQPIAVDVDPPLTVRSMPDPTLEGWWSKVGLFKPGILDDGETNLYLDLDLVITGGIAPLIRQFHEAPDQFWTLDDFSYSLLNPKRPEEMSPETRKLLGGYGTCNSSVMMWRGDVGADIYEGFRPAVVEDLHGDQNWITRVMWHRYHPRTQSEAGSVPPCPMRLFNSEGIVSSYKYHGTKTPIVVFHGNPKPHEVSEQWIRENWR